MHRFTRALTSAICAFVLPSLVLPGLVLPSARADDDDPGPKRIPQSRAPQTNAKRAAGDDEAEGPSILDSVPAFARLATLDKTLRDHGIHIYGVYIGAPYADLGGGFRRAAAYAGRLDIELDADLEKIAGIADTSIHANMFQIHGRDLSRVAIGNFLSTNDIAALPTTRLYELYLEHKFGDSLTVRAGQIGIDVEFITSNYAANFVDATFGWPGLPSLDLPEGGPAYPLATPALRARYEVNDHLAILAAVFDGEPAGPGPGDPQTRDRYGLNFRISDAPLVFAEAQYRYNQGNEPTNLPGTFKLGAFGHFGRFDDQRLGSDGLPLAGRDVAALSHRDNGGLYAILDQQIYRVPGDAPQRGIGVFARAIVAPPDRNLIDAYIDVGFAALGLVPGRPADLFGIAGAFANISPAARAADLDADITEQRAAPIRNFEAVIEMTYSAEVVPGLALQPTFQYIVHPGANVVSPLGGVSTASIPNAEVFGVSMNVRF